MTSPYRILQRIAGISIHTLLAVTAVLMLIPVIWLSIQSFLPTNDALKIPPVWGTLHPSVSSYQQVMSLIPFVTFLLNSIKLTLIITFGAVTTSTLAAYAFARLTFPGRDVIFLVMLGALMVPNQVTAAPTYVLMHFLGLATSQTAAWLPNLVNVFGIFLLRQFFRGIPRDLEDAARIDGMSTVQILWKVILPLSRPALAALAILIGTTAWNDYFWPSIYLTNQSEMTLPVGLVALQGEYNAGSPIVMFAAVSMAVIPLLAAFIFAQRAITESLAMTGFK